MHFTIRWRPLTCVPMRLSQYLALRYVICREANVKSAASTASTTPCGIRATSLHPGDGSTTAIPNIQNNQATRVTKRDIWIWRYHRITSVSHASSLASVTSNMSLLKIRRKICDWTRDCFVENKTAITYNIDRLLFFRSIICMMYLLQNMTYCPHNT